MAPEILNYVPGVNPKSSEYTNAVDIWALGCMVYRLVNGVVPFPPGPSLLNFCGDESKFPSQGSALSELGASFVQQLVVPYPSRRLTAQQALDHTWTEAHSDGSEVENPPVLSDFKGSESSTAHPTTPIKRNGLDSIASFGGYTVTHAGLQSYGTATSTQRLNPVHAESGRPKDSYHPPTVEDEEDGEDEATGAHGVETKIALDQRHGQSSGNPVSPVKANTHGVPDEAEAPDVTIKRSHRKSDNFRSKRPEVITTVSKKPAKHAAPESVSPELSDLSSDLSWEIYSNDSSSPRPQHRQAPEPTRYIVDRGRSVPITARHHSDVRGVEEGSSARRSKSPNSRRAREPAGYLINNGHTSSFDARNRAEQHSDEEEASNASDRNEPPPPAGVRESTRYTIDNGRSVPVTSRHRAGLRDSNEASYTRDRSVSPPIPPTRSPRRYYSKPLRYEEQCESLFPSLTLDSLNRLAAEHGPSDFADGLADATSESISETRAVGGFRTMTPPFSENGASPIPSSDPAVNVPSSGRRVYFADERGYVDDVPERPANRRGDILEAPEPPTAVRKGNNKNAKVRSSRVIIPKMTMEDKNAIRVLEWQKHIARCLGAVLVEPWPKNAEKLPNPIQLCERSTITQPKIPPHNGGSSRKGEGPSFGDVKYSPNYYNAEEEPVPEPIIHNVRPKWPSRDKGSSCRDTDINGQPLFGDVEYAGNYGADQDIYGRHLQRYEEDTDFINQEGPAWLYASNMEPEPIIYAPRRAKMFPREGSSSRNPATSRGHHLYEEVKYAPQYRPPW